MPDRRRGLVRLASTPAASGGTATAALKAVVRDVLALHDDQTVVIQQLACVEPGCPPVETVVAVLSAKSPPQRWTLHLPLSNVTPEDIRTTLIQGDHQ
jgi:hypothetical protein